jgi:pimeloyl-[acyl-carrier protein] synthase
VEERLRAPQNDFISVLTNGEKIGAMTRHQVLVNTALLLFAGHETTMNLICNGMLAFIRNPEQWALFKSDPDKWSDSAAEECLRYDPPVKSTQRIASQDVERNGKVFKQGDRIRWVISAANRDPEIFPNPDTFDIARSPNPHIAFGEGVHHCPWSVAGADRGTGSLQGACERFPALKLESESLEYQPSVQFRSLKALPVTW